MLREQLDQLLKQRPFQPLRLHLTDGRMFDIPYTGMTLLAQTYVNVGIPVTNGPHPICDRLEHIPLLLIDRVESNRSASSAIS